MEIPVLVYKSCVMNGYKNLERNKQLKKLRKNLKKFLTSSTGCAKIAKLPRLSG